MKLFRFSVLLVLCSAVFLTKSFAQQATVAAKLDGVQIVIGDRARLFIEVTQPQGTRLQWAVMPDTFGKLEIVERGKIDTLQQGGVTLYKQRLLVTGWDSGLFKIPSFTFTAIPQSGAPYTLNTDSFRLIVSTVPVDTTQPFKPIKAIMEVKGSWLDYLLYILGGALLAGLVFFVVYYFRKNKKAAPVFLKPQETLQEKTLRHLAELDAQELWQKGKVKEYYITLTDILRGYLEARFRVPALEQTTDELLHIASRNLALNPHRETLGAILRTADLAKFAKAQPLPAEHTNAMVLTKEFVRNTPSAPVENQQSATTS